MRGSNGLTRVAEAKTLWRRARFRTQHSASRTLFVLSFAFAGVFGGFVTTSINSQRLEAHAFTRVTGRYAKLAVYVLASASQSFTKFLSEQWRVYKPQEPKLFLGPMLPRLAEREDLLLTGAALVLSALRQTALTHDEAVPTSVGQMRRREGHQVVRAVLFGPCY